jgi:de-etiolated-1
VYPFAMSISIAYMQPTLVNFHVRSAPGDEMHDITRAGLL